MKWARRFRARLKAVLRAWKGFPSNSEWKEAQTSSTEVLTILVSASKSLLNDPQHAAMMVRLVGDSARKSAERATEKRVGLA